MVTARRSAWVPHAVLIAGLMLVLFPIYVAFVASSHALPDILEAPMTLVPGPRLAANFAEALSAGTAKTSGQPVTAMLLNSLVMALVIAAGKIAISLPSAYAVVFFRFPLRRVCFWAIFVTLMLPVEVRIIPTYKIVADLSLIDTYGGLTLPLVASATATLLFRQFFLTIPDELVEAAKIDGAGPWRFLFDTVIPLSRTDDDDRHRHPPDDRQWRHPDRMAHRDGNRAAGDHAAGRGGRVDAALVRARFGRSGEIRGQ